MGDDFEARADGSDEALRAWVYREVGALFDTVPDALTFDVADCGVAYPRTRDAIRALVREVGRRRRIDVEAEQVRLFVNAPGGIPAPPYASYYLDGTLLGPSCAWVAQEYRRQALEVDTRAGQPADFAGTELEYLYFLCRHQIAARLTGDDAARDAAARAEARFFRTHLALWLPRFLRDVRSAAPDGVVGRVADLLEAFCREESARLAATVP